MNATTRQGWHHYATRDTRAEANDTRRQWEALGFTTGSETRADGRIGVIVWAPRA